MVIVGEEIRAFALKKFHKLFHLSKKIVTFVLSTNWHTILMKHLNQYILFLAFIGILFSACQQNSRFQIEGTITNASGQTIILEHRGVSGIAFVDSMKVRADGSFRFRSSAPNNPEFYQLRIANQAVVFAVYGDETLTVTADADNFFISFVVIDSPANDQIRRIDLLRLQVEQAISDLDRQFRMQEISEEEYVEQFQNLIGIYKDQARDIIMANPASAAAYYALFQQIDGHLIFDPHIRQDFAMFGAVATSWNLHFPETIRTEHLYNFTILALHQRRQLEQQMQIIEEIGVTVDATMPDIVLPDGTGNNVALSSLRGRIVILDFTLYATEFSEMHNRELYRIYNQFRQRGLEIFQVSFDHDTHLWNNTAVNLPWITVRDPQSVQSPLLLTYNIMDLPTVFLVDSDGDLVLRVESYEQLVQEVNRLL